MNRQRVTDIVRAFRESADLYGVQHGYVSKDVSVDDLIWRLELTKQEATDVMTLMDTDDDTPDLSDLTDEQKIAFVDEIVEGLHSSLDGWDYNDQTVIELFIIDITRNITIRRRR